MDSTVRRLVREQLDRIIASGGNRRKSKTRKSKTYDMPKKKRKHKRGMGMYDYDGYDGEGLQAGRKKKKKSSDWIDHVKDYAKKHGLSYSEALQSKGVSRGYRKVGKGRRKMTRKKKA